MVGSPCKFEQFHKNNQAFHTDCYCCSAMLRAWEAWPRQQPESGMEACPCLGSCGIGESPHSLRV